jgi:hypothetical protein
MSELETLLFRLGRELGRDAAQMRPIIDHVINDCWYDTLASLRSIESEEDWAKLKLPPRLLTMIKKEIQSPSESAFTTVCDAPKSASAAVASTPSAASASDEALQLRRAAFVQNFDGLLVEGPALEVLRRVLTNLVTHPADPKFRQLNKDKVKTSLVPSASAMEALTLLSFREEADVLVLSGEVPVAFARQLLEQLPAFNAYAASFTATAGAMAVPHAKAAADRDRERQAMKTEVEAATLQAATPEPSFRITTVEATLGKFQGPSWLQVEAAGDEELVLEAWRATQLNAGERTFASREKAELLKRKKELKYTSTTCSLRIIFPDKNVLEIMHNFKPSDRVQTVVDTLRSRFLLSDEEGGVRQFSLFLPPRRLDLGLTCEAAGLVPQATLRFNVDAPRGFTGPFLKNT